MNNNNFSDSNLKNEDLLTRFLDEEILKNEKFKTTLMIYLFISFVVLTVGAFFFSHTTYEDTKLSRTVMFIMSGAFIFAAFRANNLRLIYKKWAVTRKSVPLKIQYIDMFFNISFPTAIFYIVGYNLNSPEVLSFPVPLAYVIMMAFSILSLNYKLLISAGIMAAAQYILIIFYFIHQFDTSSFGDNYTVYISIAPLLLISGLTCAIISHQFRKRIIRTITLMLERNDIVSIFGQQISQSVAEELINNPQKLDTKKTFVCIMFLDIRGFTTYAENKEPEEIIEYQNRFFSFTIDNITKNHGIINQILGDGLMATFGAPVSYGNPAENAVNASIDILNALKENNDNKTIPHTEIGIGLHCGEVVVGNVGNEIRRQYSITGNTVILSSRIQELNKQYNSSFLISNEVYLLVEKYKDLFICVGESEVKGRHTPVKLWKYIQENK